MDHKIELYARGGIVELLENEKPGIQYWMAVQRTSMIVPRYGSRDLIDPAEIEGEVRERFDRLINGKRREAREVMRHARASAVTFARDERLARSIDEHFDRLAKLLEDDTITVVWRDR